MVTVSLLDALLSGDLGFFHLLGYSKDTVDSQKVTSES